MQRKPGKQVRDNIRTLAGEQINHANDPLTLLFTGLVLRKVCKGYWNGILYGTINRYEYRLLKQPKGFREYFPLSRS
jgi:hypothetical protein